MSECLVCLQPVDPNRASHNECLIAQVQSLRFRVAKLEAVAEAARKLPAPYAGNSKMPAYLRELDSALRALDEVKP